LQFRQASSSSLEVSLQALAPTKQIAIPVKAAMKRSNGKEK
jgi:hypothetical protein